MVYELVIKNGTVVDGSGLPRFRADVGIWRGRIAAIGRIRDRAREVVTPRARSWSPRSRPIS
jgi:N-acyl-D-amino-acid deacylase